MNEDIHSGIAEIIDGHDYISLDIFDTLIARYTHHPRDVFLLMENTLEKRYPGKLHGFAEARVDAENAARQIAHRRGQEEVTFREIYGQLQALSQYDHALLSEAAELEIDLELKLCKSTGLGAFLSDYFARNKNKRVIITSDMYLDIDTISKILSVNKISYFEKIFLSSEIGRTKHSSNLYKDLVSYFGCGPSEILHIGDNFFADKQQADRAGLKGYHIAPARAFFDRHETWNSTNLFNTSAHGSKILFNSKWVVGSTFKGNRPDFVFDSVNETKEAYWRGFGELVLAPLLTTLAVWLKEEIQRSGCGKVAFLARDGQIVKKAFDLLYGDQIETDYVFASRRMLTLPFEILTEREIENYFHHVFSKAGTAREAVAELPGAERIIRRLEELEFDLDGQLDPASKKAFLKLLGENAGLIKGALSTERQVVTRYLREKLHTASPVAIFDLGWRGSLQAAISKADPDFKKNLIGYYYGTTDEAFQKLSLNEHSYFSFSMHNSKPEYYRHGCQSYTDVIEFLFSADHASVETVKETSEGWQPVFMPISEKERETQSVARIIQDAALQAIGSLKNEVGLKTLEELSDRAKAIPDFIRFLDNPGPVASRHFSEVRVFSGIGDREGSLLIAGAEDKSNLLRLRKTRWKSAFWSSLSSSERRYINTLIWLHSRSAIVRKIYKKVGA